LNLMGGTVEKFGEMRGKATTKGLSIYQKKLQNLEKINSSLTSLQTVSDKRTLCQDSQRDTSLEISLVLHNIIHFIQSEWSFAIFECITQQK